MKRENTALQMFLLLLIFVMGCAHVNYVGKSFAPTDQVDVYYSKAEIEQEYTVIGHAVGGGQILVSTGKIQRRLIETAKSKGADAILISEIGRDNNSEGEGFDAEKQIKASFIRYKISKEPAETGSR